MALLLTHVAMVMLLYRLLVQVLGMMLLLLLLDLVPKLTGPQISVQCMEQFAMQLAATGMHGQVILIRVTGPVEQGIGGHRLTGGARRQSLSSGHRPHLAASGNECCRLEYMTAAGSAARRVSEWGWPHCGRGDGRTGGKECEWANRAKKVVGDNRGGGENVRRLSLRSPNSLPFSCFVLV